MTAIHEAIKSAMRDIAKTGISKLQKNKDQNYYFRGVEAAMNEMSPILIRAGITIVPTYSELSITPSESKSGTKLRFATVKGSFRFEADDGSFVVAEFYGEGMDTSDKAISKAQSVAYRTALFETFVVPFMAIDPEVDGDGVINEPPSQLLAAARKAADRGREEFGLWWKSTTPDDRAALRGQLIDLEARCKAAGNGARQ